MRRAWADKSHRSSSPAQTRAGGWRDKARRHAEWGASLYSATAVRALPRRFQEVFHMPKSIEHIHWPDAPDLWMPYAPAIKVKGGTTVYLAGVTAAPVYHHHPHRPAEFDAMPRDMAGQARAALENLK